MRIHVLGIVGGILGLVSLGLTWLTITVDGESASGTAFDVFDLITFLGPAFDASPGLGVAIILMVVSVLLAIIGTIVAFLHPVGGAFLVAAGITGTIGALWLGRTFSIVPGASASLGIGVILSLAAGAVALGGYGTPALVLWPRPTPGQAPPGSPAISEPRAGASPVAYFSSSGLPPPPPPPIDVAFPSSPSPGGASPLEPGWVVELNREIRGVEEAIGKERASLSLIEGAVTNGDIDNRRASRGPGITRRASLPSSVTSRGSVWNGNTTRIRLRRTELHPKRTSRTRVRHRSVPRSL